MSETRTHAKLSASGSSRWMACPGSVKLIESVGIDRTSQAAEEGTAAHMLAERCFHQGGGPESYIGVVFTTPNGYSYKVTKEMAEHVRTYTDLVDAASARLTEPNRLIEYRFDLGPDMGGTCDAAIVEDFGELLIFDLKYGKRVLVEAENNPQLMYYAYGIYMETGRTAESITMTVVQPRANHPDGPIRSWTITATELVDWAKDTLMPAAERTRVDDAPLVVGPQCRWCNARGRCPEANKEVALTVGKGLVPVADPRALPVERLGEILGKAEAVESYMKAVRGHVFELLSQGVNVPGYKLVEGRATRSWADPDKAEIELFCRVKDKAYEPKKLVTPAQAEKLLKEAGYEKPKEEIKDLISVTRGKTVAPEDDPREPYSPSADMLDITITKEMTDGLGI